MILESTMYSDFELNNGVVKPGILASIKGPFMEVGKVNNNNHIYSLDVIKNNILESEYTKRMLLNKTLLGEAVHPNERLGVDINCVSHNITDLWLTGDNKVLMGKADILDTPSGRIVKSLIEYGCKLGISARGSGTLIQDIGGLQVSSDYDFVTFDFTINPGFVSSRVSKVTESKEFSNSIKSLIETGDKFTLTNLIPILESVDIKSNEVYISRIKEKLNESSGNDDKIKSKIDSKSNLLVMDLQDSLNDCKVLRAYISEQSFKFNDSLNSISDRISKLDEMTTDIAPKICYLSANSKDKDNLESELTKFKNLNQLLRGVIVESLDIIKSQQRYIKSFESGKKEFYFLSKKSLKESTESDKDSLTKATVLEEVRENKSSLLESFNPSFDSITDKPISVVGNISNVDTRLLSLLNRVK